MRCVLLLLLCLCAATTLCTANQDRRSHSPLGQGKSGRTSSRRTGCKNKTTFRMTASELANQPFTYQCQQGPVAEAEAVGVNGSCRGYSPHLLMNANRCHWNVSCTFTIEGRPLVKLTKDSKEPANSPSPCIGTLPEQIEMNFTCVKKNASVTDILGQFVSTDKSEGIIRSHRLYPWTYRNGVQLGNVTFNRPSRPSGLVNLWISVRSLGILETDYLFLSWRDTPRSKPSVRLVTNSDTTFSLDNVRSLNLTFYADYDQHHTEVQGETKGFILCFQWLKRNKTPKKGSTCTRVLQPAMCASGGGGKNRGTAGPTRQGRIRSSTRNPRQPDKAG